MKKTVNLYTDAIAYAFGGVITQENHPIMYVSKKLSDCERRYSNIEREAYAVLWCVTRLKQFLRGRKFTIFTDHKPLLGIFNPTKQSSDSVSSRLLRYSTKMMEYDYVISHIDGKRNTPADALSRINMEREYNSLQLNEVNFINQSWIDEKEIREEQKNDQVISKIIKRTINGNWKKCSQLELKFKRIFQAFTLNNEILYMGSRVVVPDSLKDKIIAKAHQSHCGMDATTRLVKEEFWWPKMEDHIRKVISRCEACMRPSKAQMVHKWREEDNPWDRVHMDWAHFSAIGDILVVVDAKSGWLEAYPCKSRNSATVIKVLRTIFARWGIPKALVSDNGKEFTSNELKGWCKSVGCKKIFSPEYHPRSNGLAERMVRYIKEGLRVAMKINGDYGSFLQRMLFVHRNTSRRKDGKTPAEIMIGRRLKCPLIMNWDFGDVLQYNPKPGKHEKVEFILRKGRSTSYVSKLNGQVILAHDNQLSKKINDPVQSKTTVEGVWRSKRNRKPPERFMNLKQEGKGDMLHD